MIGGFIITGNAPKQVMLRAIGPSLQQAGLADVLNDPVLELHGADGKLLRANDNWKDSETATQIQATGVAPANDREAAITATLAPGAYTAVVSGRDGTTGQGLIEIYDLDQGADCELANISTRGPVQTGDGVMIGGFILGGESETTRVIVRALGPSLARSGVSGVLADPALELHDGNGALVQSNHNWRDEHEAEIRATGIPPGEEAEAAIVADLAPGAYTAVVSGEQGGAGVALVEVFALH